MKTETRKLLKFITSSHCVLFFFLKQPPREIKTKFTFFFADFLDSCLERLLHLNTNLSNVLELHHSRHLNVACFQKNCTAVGVWHQTETWQGNYKVYLTLLLARLADILTACLVVRLSAFSSSHRCTYCSLLHAQTAAVSSLTAVVPCFRLAVTTPVPGLLFGRKASIGQTLFGQIKKTMSSCLHRSTRCPSDGLRSIAALLSPASLFLSLPHPSPFI